jgi:hypothetical protein
MIETQRASEYPIIRRSGSRGSGYQKRLMSLSDILLSGSLIPWYLDNLTP